MRHIEKKLFLYIHKIAAITVMAKAVKPIQPLRLSWRNTQIKKPIKGTTNIPQKINDAALISLFSP